MRLALVREELPRMIVPRIQRLDHDHEPVRLQDRSSALEGLDHVRRLERHVETPIDIARHDGHPRRVHALGHVHRLAHLLQERVAHAGVAGGEIRLAPRDLVRNEHTHAHPKPLHRRRNARLVSDGTALHAIVFEGGEALGPHELELRDEVLTRMLAEHAEVRRVAEPERSRRRSLRRQ